MGPRPGYTAGPDLPMTVAPFRCAAPPFSRRSLPSTPSSWVSPPSWRPSSPATASSGAISDDGLLVLGLTVTSTILLNSLLLRYRLEPVQRIVRAMSEVDLSRPGMRLPDAHRGAREVQVLTDTFNRMLERLEQERRDAGRAVLRAQEKERGRIAQDLHDEVNQALTAILLRLSATIGSAPYGLRSELQETQGLVAQAMEELLALARQLRPTALDDHGLVAALATQVSDFGQSTGVRTRFHHTARSPRCPTRSSS